MSKNLHKNSQGIDSIVVWLYAILVAIGILCIFMVEYKPGVNVLQSFLGGTTNYSKQFFLLAFVLLLQHLFY
jgi:rod shape determining protein RodA